MQPQQPLRGLLLGLLLLLSLAAALFRPLLPGKPYPDCDNPAALAELAKLYDNRRLLHAVRVSDAHLLKDGLQARYCAVSVQWSDGSESSVNYEFDRSGSGRSAGVSIRMWVDYNGGMHGPSF